MRGMKAEGGWAVVSTEECEIHHTSDLSPYVEQRLWDDTDIPMHAKMVDAVHAHGSLAAIELAHAGIEAPNFFSRATTLAPSAGPCSEYDPVQARSMTKKDIRQIREIYRSAALRAKSAGFDIIYVYSSHAFTLPMQFLSRRQNQRTDEYGGSLINRVRLLKEVIEDTKDVVGDTCAVAVRFAIDELLEDKGIECDKEGIEVVSLLAELPDLWDVNVSDWANDSATSRFEEEGFQEQYVATVKEVTTKPVVGVGRFTSPDTMVAQIRRGILDMIGAARPSIADPFLPKKIEQGRIDDIRECIGCNICVTGEFTMTPIRCTQNPTMGEEWRRGWHPEIIPPAKIEESILIIGSGPAGLECAVSLGKRGYRVILAEAASEIGGRVSRECKLPGLSAWSRVRDYRQQQLEKLSKVEVYLNSNLELEEILQLGVDHVVVATGSRWRIDGTGRNRSSAIEGTDSVKIITPDDIMDGSESSDEFFVYDDDHFYMGGIIVEHLIGQGANVSIATPAPDVSHWTHYTLEQEKIQSRLMKLGAAVYTNVLLEKINNNHVSVRCVFTDKVSEICSGQVVLVTCRDSNDSLYNELTAIVERTPDSGIKSVDKIGDCLVPGTIAAAVYSGHLWARELGEKSGEAYTPPFLRERLLLE